LNKENKVTAVGGHSTYSRMPALSRESADYNTQGMPNNGAMHTTRIPPQMRPGLSHKGYEYL
jgi:hypothetical protein